jgi:hypothetical protein
MRITVAKSYWQENYYHKITTFGHFIEFHVSIYSVYSSDCIGND